MDLSRQLPTTIQLDGFDISTRQCPPKEWAPSNVTFYEWNVYDDPLEQFKGQYDVVHLRLIALAVLDNTVAPLIKNLSKLLSGFLLQAASERRT